jgi:malate synthase
MDEILYELREHACGLNAGRWDYLFSIVKKFGAAPGFVLPDRSKVTMTAPFMRAYTDRLVATCHRRGAHAIGGMAAFVPNRHRPEVTAHALSAVREDKRREALDGFDGSWVAHPDLVPAASAEFDAVLGRSANQLHRLAIRADDPSADELLAVAYPAGGVTLHGIRQNISVALRYLDDWLGGVGAAAIDDLMEDVATAEIARAQLWQWAHARVILDDGRTVSPALVADLIDEQAASLCAQAGAVGHHIDEARRLLVEVALGEPFVPFLTLPAYGLLTKASTR